MLSGYNNRKEVDMMNDHINFSTHIQMGRIAKNLNKSELGRRLGVTPQYISDIEKGSIPSEEVIAKIVDVLELDEYQTFKLADKLPPHIIEQAKREYFNRG
jgi:transcriptional regulator with XRE-family HTH domain